MDVKVFSVTHFMVLDLYSFLKDIHYSPLLHCYRRDGTIMQKKKNLILSHQDDCKVALILCLYSLNADHMLDRQMRKTNTCFMKMLTVYRAQH